LCIIIDNSLGKKIPEYIVNNSIEINSDGYAFYNLKTKELTKTMDKTVMENLLRQEIPFIAHCRYATVGKVSEENIHLFEVGDWLVAMNGTIRGLADSTTNDTLQVIEMIKMVKPNMIKQFLEYFEARFLLVNKVTGKKIKTGKWFKNSGVDYSKDNVLNEQTYKNRTNWKHKGYSNRYGSTNPYGDDYSGYSGTYNYTNKNYRKNTSTNTAAAVDVAKKKDIQTYLAWQKGVWVGKTLPPAIKNTSLIINPSVMKANVNLKNSSKTPNKVLLGVYDNHMRGKPYHHLLGDSAKLMYTGTTNAKYAMIKDGTDYYALSGIDIENGYNLHCEVYSMDSKDFESLKKQYGDIYINMPQFVNPYNISYNGSKIVNMLFFPREKSDTCFDTLNYIQGFT